MLPVEEPIVEEIEEEPIVEEVDTADIVDSEGTRSAPSPREITIEPFLNPEFDEDHDFAALVQVVFMIWRKRRPAFRCCATPTRPLCELLLRPNCAS